MSRLKFILPIAGFALLVGLFAIGIKRSPDHDVLASVLIGKPAPDFALPSLTNPGPPSARRSSRASPTC